MSPLPVVTPVCDWLRAKVARAAHNDKAALWAMRGDATAVFWCLLTMSPAGPDDGLVHASACGPGRACCSCEEAGANV